MANIQVVPVYGIKPSQSPNVRSCKTLSTPLSAIERKCGVYHAAVNPIAEPNFADQGLDAFNVNIQNIPESPDGQVHHIEPPPGDATAEIPVRTHTTAAAIPAIPSKTLSSLPKTSSPLRATSSIRLETL